VNSYPRASGWRRWLPLLIRRTECWSLTWPARVLLAALIIGVGVAATRGLGSFLAVSQPAGGEYLVVEAWMPVYVYREVAGRFREGHYRKIIAVGVLQEDDQRDGQLREFAAFGRLIAAGVPASAVQQALSSDVHRDRTLHAALNLKQWIDAQGLQAGAVDVVTLGPHARRSRLLYGRALGNSFRVGIIAIPDRQYDIAHWWRTSVGARAVIDEAIAYFYARTGVETI
jgi:hypothetical protein